jgi:hypothetical protein
MANYHSIIHNYGRPQSNFNQELALQALSYKQGRYDANAAKIQETLNAYGDIELARPEDREYLYERLNRLVNNINGLSTADLSSTNVTSGIMGHISKALDENVLKQIQNTQKIKSFQSQVQEIKKSKPDQYSDVNYQVALMKSGYVDYINGNTDDLGDISYTPHVDVTGEITKKLKDITAIKGGKQVVQVRDGQGNIIEREIDGLTQTELEALVPTLIDDRMRAQLNVNGYYRYGGSKEAAVNSIQPQYEKKLASIETEITNLRTQIDSPNVDTATTEKYRQQIKNLETQREVTQKTYNRLSEGDAGFIGGYLEEQNLVSTMSQTLQARASEKYLSDNAYWKSLELAEKRRANDLKERELVGQESIPSVTTAPIASDLMEKVDTYNEIKSAGKKLGEQYYNTATQQYNNLTEEQKQKVDALTSDIKYQGLDEREKRTRAMMDAGVLDPQAQGALNNLARKYKNYLEDDQKVYEATLTNALESEGFYDALKNNKNITLTDSNGRVVSYDQYLRSLGINSKEDYNNFIKDETLSKAFKEQLTANAALSANTGSTYAASQNNLGHVLKGKEAGSIDKNLLLQIERLLKVTGEKMDITDLLEVENVSYEVTPGTPGLMINPNSTRKVDDEFIKEHVGDLKERYRIKLNPKASNTRAYKVLKTALDNGTWDTQKTVIGELFSMDNSVQDDSTLRSALSYENFEKQYKEAVTQNGIRLKGYNAMSINPSTGEKNKVLLFESLRAPLAAGIPLEGQDEDDMLKALKNGVGVQLMRQPGSTDNFIVTQGGKSAVIPKNVLQNYPEVVRLIDLEENNNQLVVENQPPLKVENFNYKPFDVENLDYLAQRYGQGTPMFYSATKQGALGVIQQTTDNPQLVQVMKIAMDNANRFSAEVKNKNGRNYVDVYFDGQRISQITDADREQVESIIDYDPQILVTLALRNIAIEVQNQNTENYEKLYGRLNSK